MLLLFVVSGGGGDNEKKIHLTLTPSVCGGGRRLLLSNVFEEVRESIDPSLGRP